MRDALVVASVIAVIGVAALVTCLAVVSRRVVRRLHSLRTRMREALPAGFRIPGPEVAATVWPHLRRSLFDVRVGSSSGSKRESLILRRQLWQHVDGANAALSQAQAGDAPLGDLPLLTSRMGDLARRHDRELALLGRDHGGINLERARADVDQIVGCADDIAIAAFESLRSVPSGNPEHMRFLIGQETEAVRAGAAYLRSISIPDG